MHFKFYDMKTRSVVLIHESDINKILYSRRLKTGRIQIRYALKTFYKDRWLTKYCTKALYDCLNIPVLSHTS